MASAMLLHHITVAALTILVWLMLCDQATDALVWNGDDDVDGGFRDSRMPPLLGITSTSFDVVHTHAAGNGNTSVVAQRRGKFFFDALFGLGTAVVNSGAGTIVAGDDDDEEDDEDDDTADDTKQCNCREFLEQERDGTETELADKSI